MDIVFIIHSTLHIMFLALVLHYIFHFFATKGFKDTDDDKNWKDKNPRIKVNDTDSDTSEDMKLSKAKIVSPFAGYGITRTKIVDIASPSEPFSSNKKDEDKESKKKKAVKKKASKKRNAKKRTVRKSSIKNDELEDIFKEEKFSGDSEKVKEEKINGNSEKVPIIITETIEHEEIGKGMNCKVPVLVLRASELRKGKNSARHINCMKESSAEQEKGAKKNSRKKSEKNKKKKG